MTLPNFLIIGAGRTGTTSLYNYLNQHPQIFMSEVKEPRFFVYENQTPNFSGPTSNIPLPKYCSNIDKYKELFSAVENEVAVGEASVDYFYIKEASSRIKYHIPDVKLILILRHPVDRAYSQFWARVSAGVEPLTSFEEALAVEGERILNFWPPQFHYKHKSLYASSLKRFYELFAENQIKIVIYDEYQKAPENTVKEIAEFLGVNSDFKFDFNRRYNSPRGIAKYKRLNNILNTHYNVKNTIKLFIPNTFIPYLRNAYSSFQYSRRPMLDKKLRKELTKLFSEDILEVQKLINKDLSRWMK